jgi:hypothetical protein
LIYGYIDSKDMNLDISIYIYVQLCTYILYTYTKTIYIKIWIYYSTAKMSLCMYIVYRDMDMGIATSSHVNRENDDNPLEFWVLYFQTNPNR